MLNALAALAAACLALVLGDHARTATPRRAAQNLAPLDLDAPCV